MEKNLLLLAENRNESRKITSSNRSSNLLTNNYFLPTKRFSNGNKDDNQPNNLITKEFCKIDEQDIYSLMTKPSPSLKKDDNITNELNQFLLKPLSSDQYLSCNILLRDGNYFMYSNQTELFMLSAFKQRNKLRYNYKISCDRNNDSIPYRLGKLHANITNSEFILYDNGLKPKPSTQVGSKPEKNRRYLMELRFNYKTPFKQATVYQSNNSDYYNNDSKKNDKLSAIEKNKTMNGSHDIEIYESLNPEWSSKYQSFIQNYSTRIKEASKSNFQFVHKSPSFSSTTINNKTTDILIECGKINNRVYALDFKGPFSPLQAFAIALSFLI